MAAILTLLLLVILPLSGLSAQTLTVKSRGTGQPLPYSTVSCRGLNFSAVADSRGRVDITKLSEADSISISHVGHQSVVRSFWELRDRNFVVYLEEVPVSGEELVVSATRWEQSSRNVPVSMSVLHAETIELHNPQTAADLIGLSDQVLIQKSQYGGGSPMIRGFAANRVLIAVDGVRMNTAIYRSGNLHNVISADPMTTEAAEIVHGPASSVYGSDALGGVMNFRTKIPRISPDGGIIVTGSSTLRVGSASSEQSGHFDLNIGSRKMASLTSVSYSHFDDLKMGRVGPDEYLRSEYQSTNEMRDTSVSNPNPRVQVESGFDQYHFAQKLIFDTSSNWRFKGALHYSPPPTSRAMTDSSSVVLIDFGMRNGTMVHRSGL